MGYCRLGYSCAYVIVCEGRDVGDGEIWRVEKLCVMDGRCETHDLHVLRLSASFG